jgi:hypothetical protein
VLRVQRDATVAAGSAPTKLEILGIVKGAALVVIDSYPSLPGGMPNCHAGEELFLRVISLRGKTPRETYCVKLERCRDNIEPGSKEFDWRPEIQRLSIQWLQALIRVKTRSRRARRLIVTLEHHTQLRAVPDTG